jgi:predicted transcriptional regulator
MATNPVPKPTDAELAILAVLWQLGPSTVREVHDELERSEPVRYTTTLKQMQVMFEKGLLARDESLRAHVYRPAMPEEGTLRQVTSDLLDRVFGGSAEKLVMHALQARRASPEELANIRKLIDHLGEGGQ